MTSVLVLIGVMIALLVNLTVRQREQTRRINKIYAVFAEAAYYCDPSRAGGEEYIAPSFLDESQTRFLSRNDAILRRSAAESLENIIKFITDFITERRATV